MPHDGLYLICPTTARTNTVLSYDTTSDQIGLTDLDASLVPRSTFYIHKLANHDAYEIHNTHENKSLRASSSGMDIGRGDSDEHRSYRWKISHSSSGGYKITNVSHTSQRLTAKDILDLNQGGTVQIGTPYHGPWDLLRIDAPVSKQNQDGADVLEGKSAKEWRKVAQKIFKEGLKTIEFACADTWTERTADEQESYADLFRKYGEDAGLES
ncbi:hypothetical protein CLCR_02601 [Cladophialophora carrionii]|uniref:Ricin B lectin domain-containing protein n=1 Tax=Cladophialophora carrionii TaxID=86049 RepID=A0A1C1CEY9_9EURO|nr:hypothetical protein CLCR_02601 [Cladophialophora carrionii]